MKFCPHFKRSFLSSFPITAHSVKGSVSGGWEEEGGVGPYWIPLRGSFFHLDTGALCWYLLIVARLIQSGTLCWALQPKTTVYTLAYIHKPVTPGLWVLNLVPMTLPSSRVAKIFELRLYTCIIHLVMNLKLIFSGYLTISVVCALKYEKQVPLRGHSRQPGNSHDICLPVRLTSGWQGGAETLGVDPCHPLFSFSSVSSLMPRKLRHFPLHVAGSNLCHNLYVIWVHSLLFLGIMSSLMSGPGRFRLLTRKMYEETWSNYLQHFFHCKSIHFSANFYDFLFLQNSTIFHSLCTAFSLSTHLLTDAQVGSLSFLQ